MIGDRPPASMASMQCCGAVIAVIALPRSRGGLAPPSPALPGEDAPPPPPPKGAQGAIRASASQPAGRASCFPEQPQGMPRPARPLGRSDESRARGALAAPACRGRLTNDPPRRATPAAEWAMCSSRGSARPGSARLAWPALARPHSTRWHGREGGPSSDEPEGPPRPELLCAARKRSKGHQESCIGVPPGL